MFVWGLIDSTNGRRLIACDCIPIDGQEGALAVYRQSPAARGMRQSPAAGAMRLTAYFCAQEVSQSALERWEAELVSGLK